MKHMLHAVDHGRVLRTFGDVHDPLQPQQIRATVLGQSFQKERQRDRLDRLGTHDRKGSDFGVMMLVGVVGRLRQP